MSSSARFFPPLIKFQLSFKEKGGFLNRFESALGKARKD